MTKADDLLVPVPAQFAAQSLMKEADFAALTRQALADPDKFWGLQGEKYLHWFRRWDRVKKTSFCKPVSIEWYQGGQTNVAYNCLDRHLDQHADRTALIWEPDAPTSDLKVSGFWPSGSMDRQVARAISYRQLFEETCRMANVLLAQGVRKGDVVTIYLPMVPEAAVAMLACTRIGAVHSVVFGGFSPDSIADRIRDGQSTFVITADEGRRGGKTISLKKNIDVALSKTTIVKKVLVVQVTGNAVDCQDGRDSWWHQERVRVSADCPAVPMGAEDPLFILYTSGSTGKPKGVLHTTAGYNVYAAYTFANIFDYKLEDIYWCTADVGWITGHSYIVYGPLTNAATAVIFEGVPNYPDASRFWRVIDKHRVSIFYTAPTAIRALMREGEEPVRRTSRRSLRLLGSVGEPINPEAWQWFHQVVGESRCPIVDTWWQTETGGILISPLPGATALKPGSATKPLPGIVPVMLTPEGQKIEGPGEGVLVLADSWPGQMRTVYRDHARFEETYFSAYPGYYFSGDGCRRDPDGYWWITGRVDDVLNVSGHRLGSAEIESALVAHPQVAEAAVVGFPHDMKGQGIYVYVTLKNGVAASEDLRRELINWVGREIGPIAKPDLLQWAPGLPKTRSGKIMRRILRKIAENQTDQLGDTSTLADPGVVQELIANRQQVGTR